MESVGHTVRLDITTDFRIWPAFPPCPVALFKIVAAMMVVPMSNWNCDANSVQVIADRTQAIADWVPEIAAIAAIVTLLLSIKTSIHAARLAHYGELDRMYAELLKQAVDRPYLRNYMKRRFVRGLAKRSKLSLDVEAEYDVYAYAVWNFVEAVYDRLQDRKLNMWLWNGKLNRSLQETWEPVIKTEHSLHKGWFEADDHRNRFKYRFGEFVDRIGKGATGAELWSKRR